MSDFDEAFAADALVESLKPLFAGHNPGVQGAALADLLAIWLAGHIIVGDADATRTLRAGLLAHHCSAVRMLVDLYDEAAG